VESSGVLGSLLARKLIATAGRKPVIGRPILYKTTREFLLRFGLKDVSELPSMEEFEKMAATELEMEPEVAAADRAEEAAERAGLEAEAELESNSPSDEEPAATADAGNGASSIDKAEGPENAEEQGAPAAAGLEPPPANDQTDAAEPAEPQSPSSASNQSEATLHAEESKEEV
jgi:segregation and condensation protein B